MIKEFSMNRKNVILNFSANYCKTAEQLLDSSGFSQVMNAYVDRLHRREASLYDRMVAMFIGGELAAEVTMLLKLLVTLEKRDVRSLNATYDRALTDPTDLIEFVEGLYNFWRRLERYALILQDELQNGIDKLHFMDAKNDFTNLVLKVYRRIEENIIEHDQNVYRQLSAGINAGLVLKTNGITLPSTYDSLAHVPVIQKVVFTPPFIVYPKQNKRSGLFTETFEHPLTDVVIHPMHFFCYPAMVGDSLALIYFHRDFMNHGISLCNLFELATAETYQNRKPDLLYIFGARRKEALKETVYHYDKTNDIHVGFVANTEDIDYFGYMKKMILTLHNLRKLRHGHLPIHGAMVNITLKNGIQKNIAIIGDSGAGKSESLEAFRILSEDYLKEIKIIFDDMGSFELEGDKVVGYGTETGAFVRLDDLEMGYSFEQMDRAIFMNPHRINARVLLPITTYDTVIKGYPVDMLLYANNYDETDDILQFFSDVDTAKAVFLQGKRKAKGTTSESGIVESFFANPFGPMQEPDVTTSILDLVFQKLFDTSVPVGQIHTKLAIPSFERKGPEDAARKLFEWLMQGKTKEAK